MQVFGTTNDVNTEMEEIKIKLKYIEEYIIKKNYTGNITLDNNGGFRPIYIKKVLGLIKHFRKSNYKKFYISYYLEPVVITIQLEYNF